MERLFQLLSSARSGCQDQGYRPGQIQYASDVKCIAHPQLSTAEAEDDAAPELHELYVSLLGARVDALVFVSPLRRHTHAPKVDHARKLNELLRWIQQRPEKFTYKRFNSDPHATSHWNTISDAAFKRDTDAGYSLRGALYLRGGGQQSDSLAANQSTVRVIDWVCKSQQRIFSRAFISRRCK